MTSRSAAKLVLPTASQACAFKHLGGHTVASLLRTGMGNLNFRAVVRVSKGWVYDSGGKSSAVSASTAWVQGPSMGRNSRANALIFSGSALRPTQGQSAI